MSAPIGGTFPGGWGAVGAARKQQIRLVSIDFPTACWRVLFVLVVLAHQCRRVLRFHVTEHPTAAWTARQIVYAFPDDSAPAYLRRDRDTVYGDAFRQRVRGMRIREVLTAAQSPWAYPFAERLSGSIGQDCLAHVLVLPHSDSPLTCRSLDSHETTRAWPR